MYKRTMTTQTLKTNMGPDGASALVVTVDGDLVTVYAGEAREANTLIAGYTEGGYYIVADEDDSYAAPILFDANGQFTAYGRRVWDKAEALLRQGYSDYVFTAG